MNDQIRGLAITTAGVLFVVPDSLFVRLIAADPLVIAFWRGLISGALILVGILLVQGMAPVRAVLGTGRYGAIYVLATGGSGILFVLAISLTSVANVVFIIASLPVFAALFSRVFLAEPIRPRMVVTMAAVAVGLGIIAWGSAATRGAHWSGDAVALGYLAAAALLWPFIAPLAVAPGKWGLVALHGLFITASAVGLALGPRYITSAEVGLLILLESVLAPLLAWAVIGEGPGMYALIGGAVVVGTLAVSNLVALRRRR